MNTRSASSHHHLHKSATSVNFDCMWSPSINVINTELSSPRPAVVLPSAGSEHGGAWTAWSNMLWWRQVSVKTWDQQSVFMLFWPAWFHPFPFPVTKPYPEAAINQEGLAWLFFHLDGWKMVSKFAAFYPKHPLSSPMMTTVFLPRISATKPEKMTVKKNKQT